MPPHATDSRLPIVVLASGRGSNLQALFKACSQGDCAARIEAVISDRASAPALTFARDQSIATAVFPYQKGQDRDEWNEQLATGVAMHKPRLVVLAGFMRILGAPFVRRFDGRIINVHPSLLPAFRGKDAPSDALAARVRITGCTVHIVDEEVDHGPILAQAAVTVHPEDDRERLHQRIRATEHVLLPTVVHAVAVGDLKLEGQPTWTSGTDWSQGPVMAPAPRTQSNADTRSPASAP